MSGLGTQIDGGHYTSMKMQPIELAYRLYGTPCFCKLAKYLTRDKGHKLTNLQKARHCITLEQDLSKYAMAYFDHLDFVSLDEAKKLIDEFTKSFPTTDPPFTILTEFMEITPAVSAFALNLTNSPNMVAPVGIDDNPLNP